MFDLDKDYITTGLRLLVVLILGVCAIFARKIAVLIGNRRFYRFAKRLFWTLAFFAAARAVAAFLDAMLTFEIGIFSNIVNNGFYLMILYLLIRLWQRLKNEEPEIIHSGQSIPNPNYINKHRISLIIEELFDELKVNIEKTNKLEEEMKKHIT